MKDKGSFGFRLPYPSKWKQNRNWGLCGDCGKAPEPGKTRCQICLDRQSANANRKSVGEE